MTSSLNNIGKLSEAVKQRFNPGDWEIDTVICHGKRSAVLTATARKSSLAAAVRAGQPHGERSKGQKTKSLQDWLVFR